MANIGSIASNLASQFSNAASVVSKVAKDIQSAGTAVADLKTFANNLSSIIGSPSGNTAKSAPMADMPSMQDLFGGNVFEADNKKKQEAAKSTALAGGAGGAMSLGALLAMVGGILVKSIETTMKGLADAATQLDGATSSKGPTAALNQKIQELTFNLQQIQQTLNRVNETVTNLSRSQSEAEKTTAQNLSV